jgi:hypothetical protein
MYKNIEDYPDTECLRSPRIAWNWQKTSLRASAFRKVSCNLYWQAHQSVKKRFN